MPVTLAGEWNKVLRHTGLAGGNRRGLVLLVLVTLLFGVYLPFAKGFDFLDIIMLTAYSLLSGVFAGPAAIGLVAPPEPLPAPAQARVKIVAAAFYGWAVAIAIVSLGIVAVNAFHWIGKAVYPSGKVLAAAAAVGLASSAWIAALGVALGMRLRPLTAQGVLRMVFLTLLTILVFRGQIFPERWLEELSLHMTADGYPALAATLCAIFSGLALATLAVLQLGSGKRS